MGGKAEQAEKIRNNIKELRGRFGWNQAKLASEANISAAALSKIEQGGDRVPTILVLRKIANALRVEIHDITGEQPVNRSATAIRDKEFYRKFNVLDELEDNDQKLMLEMAQRLKEMTKK